MEELMKMIEEIEEEGRQEARWSESENEIQHGYGIMDAMKELKNKLNTKE